MGEVESVVVHPLLLAMLAGCIWPAARDDDDDGYAGSADCDDFDPLVNPGMVEVCNGVDDNCDGQIDGFGLPGAPVWFPDGDQDGFGNPDYGLLACYPPGNYVARGTDCDDSDAAVRPGAIERACNGIDEDCDERTPDAVDRDGDLYDCLTDCDDTDPTVNPLATDHCFDGIDNDCDGVDLTDHDPDHDGWSVCDGDCQPYIGVVNPGATEALDDHFDNDCDGIVDASPPCDCGPTATFAQAIGLCNDRFVASGTVWTPEVDADESWGTLRAAVEEGWGNADLDPRHGCRSGFLTTGRLWSSGPNPAYDISGDDPPTDPQCSRQDPLGPFGGSDAVCDLVQYRLTLRAPNNARGFSFAFDFVSSEYPEWLDQGYNDAFYVIIEAASTNGGLPTNISVDPVGQPIEVDNSFFEEPGHLASLRGTQYAVDAGATGWLRTSWPITPNETFTLTFSIHDAGDAAFDSLVLIDHFAWSADPVDDGTGRPP